MDKVKLLEIAKQVIDLAEKTPQIAKLKEQCKEIIDGKRSEVSKKIIDDAFDAFGIIVKKITSTSDEENELYKCCWKNWWCDNLRIQGLKITE